jgi:hypothetical protein
MGRFGCGLPEKWRLHFLGIGSRKRTRRKRSKR